MKRVIQSSLTIKDIPSLTSTISSSLMSAMNNANHIKRIAEDDDDLKSIDELLSLLTKSNSLSDKLFFKYHDGV